MKIIDYVRGAFAAKPTSAPKAAGSLFSDQAVGLVLSELFGIADPDEVLRKAGMTRSTLRALEGDDEISTALESRQAATVCAPWRLEPYDATIAPFIEAELSPLIEHAMSGAWSAVPYGYSVLEAVYVRRDDGRIGLAALEEKPFEWFRPLRDGRLLYTAQGKTEAVDTTAKFFLTRRRASYRNPYGEALLSRAYWPWFMRNAGWRAWVRFLERAAAPLLLGKTAGDKSKMAAALADAALSGAVAIGAQDSVESVGTGNNGQAFSLFQGEVDRRIQKLILGQTLTTDSGKGGGGSYALGKVHDKVKGDRVAADQRMLQPTCQRIVNALVALNFPAAKAPPTFILGAERGLEPERAERDGKLVTAGIVKLTEKYLLDRYDFDRGDFEIPEKAAPPVFPVPALAPAPVPGKGKGKDAKAALFALGDDELPGQMALDDAASDAARAAGDPVSPAAIRAAIRASESPDELVERLAELFESQPPDAYRELMERALFAADIMGYAHADDGQ